METRRILLDGVPASVAREGEELVAADGRRIALGSAEHLPPSEPTKIVCVHLNYESRVQEFLARMPPAPTYFHKPSSALNAQGGAVVRPPRERPMAWSSPSFFFFLRCVDAHARWSRRAS